ncbi:MAG: DUF2249 domain-containing protein [Gemmatimonadota bacterium]
MVRLEDNRPAALAAIPPEHIVELDVREDLRNGQEPFSRIMAARWEVPPGGALRLRAIFEPVPLYGVLGKQGLTHHTEQLGPDDWQVWFYAGEDEHVDAAPSPARAGADAGAAAQAPAGADAEAPAAGLAGADHGADAAGATATADPADNGVQVLDVRGLEPPEPMVRTLAALEALPPDGTLVQLNVRVPRFLLPQLEERGFSWEIREQAPDLVRLFIRRAPSA